MQRQVLLDPSLQVGSPELGGAFGHP
jgi:hypothetical protein